MDEYLVTRRGESDLLFDLPVANEAALSSTITAHILVIVVDADGQSLWPIYYWQNLFVFKTKSKR